MRCLSKLLPPTALKLICCRFAPRGVRLTSGSIASGPKQTLSELQACPKPGQPCYVSGLQEVGFLVEETHNRACMT